MAYTDTTDHIRLDNLLVELKHFTSRSRALDAIKRGTIFVDGKLAKKASVLVHPKADIRIDDPAQHYVSRAAMKLVAALDHFKIDPADKNCLDVGASTGGFTQVLLERGAAHVIALDVGHDQLDETLRADERVTVFEGLNARDLEEQHLGDHLPDIIVSDVSFISLKLALPPALELAAAGALCILLVKPQFEVGRENVGRGGIVTPELGEAASKDLEAWLGSLQGWRTTGIIASPIAGGDGNQEYLLTGRKDG
ncbi:TlyA family RNA methyltransferase [Ahrensia sp. 13_GOM-1096m]|uniref:TlyA family RNA methyltransferase n=1 Tax=Ahrensia sp. 13_GOM-1096m TaxID=1380380 RepID=UPI00047DED50|nr:TlyA family RNA methyltransferase [Ahrensia sp. 13_GOM-1096m]